MPLIQKGIIITNQEGTQYYTSSTNFPLTGKTNTLYVDKSTGAVYVWDGSDYITSFNQTLILTEAQRDLITPTNGLEIYCTDCLGSNDEVGAKQYYQSSTSSWRTYITF